jgi:thioredoxin-dependent peroxiredoxin
MMTRLEAGQVAPDFDLPDQIGDRQRLTDYKGQRLLLFFYREDDTQGCTQEAEHFARSYNQYIALGVAVLGISTDTVASHSRFSAKYTIPYPLLADTAGEMSEAYDVLDEVEPQKLRARRVTFLIDPNGIIEQVWEPVNAATHNDQVLASLQSIVNIRPAEKRKTAQNARKKSG